MMSLRKRLAGLAADPHLREVARGTVIALALKLAGAALSFAFNVVVARLLGAAGVGVYFLALSVAVIASIVGRIGLDSAILRFVATHATRGEWGSVARIYALSLRLAICAGSILTLLIFIAAPWMAAVMFGKPELGEPLRWMSLSILPFALLNLHAEALKGLKRIPEAMLIQGVGVPLVSLLVIVPLVGTAGTVGAVWAYLVATTLVALTAALLWRRGSGRLPVDDSEFRFATLWSSCKPLFVSSVMNRAILPWAPLFLLGLWEAPEAVGVFGAATRVAILVSFLLMAVNNVIAPKFAELQAEGKLQMLGRTARRAALLVTALTSPVFLVLVLGSEQIMLLFGPEFTSGATALAVLATGQLFNALCGSVSYILIVTGHETDVRNFTIVSVIVQVVACILLIPMLGLLGAAIGAAAAVIVSNLLATVVVWRRLGIITLPLVRM